MVIWMVTRGDWKWGRRKGFEFYSFWSDLELELAIAMTMPERTLRIVWVLLLDWSQADDYKPPITKGRGDGSKADAMRRKTIYFHPAQSN